MKHILLIFALMLCAQADKNASLYFNGNCTTCHELNRTVSAPSIAEVKKRYLSAFPKKADFIKYMSTWVHHPNKETSIMHDAIAEHDLMPELAFDLETLKIISAYIYETDFQ